MVSHSNCYTPEIIKIRELQQVLGSVQATGHLEKLQKYYENLFENYSHAELVNKKESIKLITSMISNLNSVDRQAKQHSQASLRSKRAFLPKSKTLPSSESSPQKSNFPNYLSPNLIEESPPKFTKSNTVSHISPHKRK